MRTIQLLNWKLKSIEKILPKIKKQGFNAIQINPMQPFKEQPDFHWWLSYQPLGFSIGNMFGTKEDLKSLCSEAKKYGINIVVDVVCNHMANASGDEFYKPHPTVDKKLLNNKDFWKPSKQNINNHNDKYDIVTNLIGLPGLNLDNKELQNIIFNYIRELNECGVKGLRIDAAKHIGLPSDGNSFFPNLQKELEKLDMYAYGEFLGGPEECVNELSNHIMVLTEYGNKINNLKMLQAFIESHDTFLNDKGWTKNWTNIDRLKNYRKLCENCNNTIIPITPIKVDINPFYYNTFGYSMDYVKKLDEIEYFNLLPLISKDIREINKENTEFRKVLKRWGIK